MPSASPFVIAELRLQILALVPVDRSFNLALLRVCRAWYEAFLPRLYSEVDLTGPKSRCVKFIDRCDLGRLERLGVGIQGLAVSGDYDPNLQPRPGHMRPLSSTTLSRLYKKLKATPAATASITTLRVVSDRSYPRETSFPEMRQLVLDVTSLAGRCPRLATLVLEVHVGKLLAVEDILSGASDSGTSRPWAQVTLEMPFLGFLRRTKALANEHTSPYFKAIRPTFDSHGDHLLFGPEEVIARLQEVVRGLAVAGLNIGALEFGSSFESYFSDPWNKDMHMPNWAVVQRFAQEHREELPFAVTFPVDLHLADALDQTELARLGGLDGMVEDMFLAASKTTRLTCWASGVISTACRQTGASRSSRSTARTCSSTWGPTAGPTTCRGCDAVTVVCRPAGLVRARRPGSTTVGGRMGGRAAAVRRGRFCRGKRVRRPTMHILFADEHTSSASPSRSSPDRKEAAHAQTGRRTDGRIGGAGRARANSRRDRRRRRIVWAQPAEEGRRAAVMATRAVGRREEGHRQQADEALSGEVTACGRQLGRRGEIASGEALTRKS